MTRIAGGGAIAMGEWRPWQEVAAEMGWTAERACGKIHPAN